MLAGWTLITVHRFRLSCVNLACWPLIKNPRTPNFCESRLEGLGVQNWCLVSVSSNKPDSNTVSYRDPTKLNCTFPRKAHGVNIAKVFKEPPLRCLKVLCKALWKKDFFPFNYYGYMDTKRKSKDISLFYYLTGMVSSLLTRCYMTFLMCPFVIVFSSASILGRRS